MSEDRADIQIRKKRSLKWFFYIIVHFGLTVLALFSGIKYLYYFMFYTFVVIFLYVYFFVVMPYVFKEMKQIKKDWWG